MKKEYTRPNMEIVSFATENIAAGLSSPTANQGIQQEIKTINYY